MIFSDLPSPAEASRHTIDIATGCAGGKPLHTFGDHALAGHRSSSMPQEPNNEWQALKDQFEKLARRTSVPDIEDVFDAEIRRRFGTMIYRATAAKQLDD
jgi:hypothetical protein